MSDISGVISVMVITMVLAYMYRFPRTVFIPAPTQELSDDLATRYRKCIIDILSDKYHAIKRDLIAVHGAIIGTSMMYQKHGDIYDINREGLHMVAGDYGKIIHFYATALVDIRNLNLQELSPIDSLQAYMNIYSHCKNQVAIVLMGLTHYHLEELALCKNAQGRYQNVDPYLLEQTAFSYHQIIERIEGYLTNIDTHDLDLTFLKTSV